MMIKTTATGARPSRRRSTTPTIPTRATRTTRRAWASPSSRLDMGSTRARGEKRPASSNGSGPKKRKKALKAPIDKFARRRDPRLSIQDAERGGAANDAEKRLREDLAADARRRAEAMAAAERAVEAFDAAAWLEGARCAVDAACARDGGPPCLRAKLEGGRPARRRAARRRLGAAAARGAVDQGDANGVGPSRRLACETFDAFLERRHGVREASGGGGGARRRPQREHATPAPPRTLDKRITDGARRPAPRGAVLRRRRAAPAAAPPRGRQGCTNVHICSRRRSDEREAEAAPIPTTAPALAPGASYATLPDRVYAAVALENDPWGRPLDEALSAKITGMIMDAYNPPYVESLLVEGIGPAMDERLLGPHGGGRTSATAVRADRPVGAVVEGSEQAHAHRVPVAGSAVLAELVVTAYEKDVDGRRVLRRRHLRLAQPPRRVAMIASHAARSRLRLGLRSKCAHRLSSASSGESEPTRTCARRLAVVLRLALRLDRLVNVLRGRSRLQRRRSSARRR